MIIQISQLLTRAVKLLCRGKLQDMQEMSMTSVLLLTNDRTGQVYTHKSNGNKLQVR